MSSVTSFEPTKALSTARPKQRSRSGCLTCRSRGYKCDEKKPICRACSRLGRSCQYGAAKKWINESVINNNRVVIKQAYGPATEGVRNRVRRVEGPKESGNGEVQNWAMGYVENDPFRKFTGCVPYRSREAIPSSLLPYSLPPLDLRLLNHWSTYLAPALDFSSSKSFCYFITPMALSPQCPPALFHALTALSAAHLASRDPALEVVALREQQKAIRLLKGIVEGNEVGEEALATVLMLRIFEDFTASPDSTAAMYHSRGASSIIRSGGIKSFTSPTAAFLLSIFKYYDVISAISLEQSPHLPSKESHTIEGSQADLFMYYTGDILHQLAEISSLVDLLKYTASSGNSFPTSEPISSIVLDRSLQIMRSLEVPIVITQSPPSHQHYLLTAEAYRHAALVYLGKVLLTWSIPLCIIPVSDSASACLAALSNVPADAPVTGRHLYPLFTAACECFEQDREFARQRLDVLAERGGGLPNVRRVWGLVRRVWMQKDALRDGEKTKLGCFEVMKGAGQVILIS